jgi:hypothetical protein
VVLREHDTNRHSRSIGDLGAGRPPSVSADVGAPANPPASTLDTQTPAP